MCGIAGIVGSSKYEERDVKKMIKKISYRGPDEQGTINLGNVKLGHARLAVVDPENGTQPMSNQDDTVWVVFNGEIYNHLEIRTKLIQKGYKFKSRCDTEVLVHLWREKGIDMLHDLIGMFSFCIWDKNLNKGILVRDRQGIKPCYLTKLKTGGFAFASEIKSLLTLEGLNIEIDDEGLNLFHTFNYTPPPKTCYKNISHLMPGTYIEFDHNGIIKKENYWEWPLVREKEEIDLNELGSLIDDSVQMQLRFDVKGCMFLSGGVDSSILAAHLSRNWNQKIVAFSLDTKSEKYGEFKLAENVARKIGNIDLVPVEYDCRIVPDNIDSILFHCDQPHGDFSFFLIRELCKAAHKEGFIVALNGDGPDETLAGFSHNQDFLSSQTRTNFALIDYFNRSFYMNETSRKKLLCEDFRTKVDPISFFESLLYKWRDLDPIDQIAAYECNALSPGNNLIKTDRMGAALSLEGRSPFLDHRISEIFAKAPQKQKFFNSTSKFLLKEYGLRFFERELMFRKKSMPTLPIGDWIKGPLYGWAKDLLMKLDPSRYNVKNALIFLEQHKKGEANHTRELRTLLMTSQWHQNLNLYIKN